MKRWLVSLKAAQARIRELEQELADLRSLKRVGVFADGSSLDMHVSGTMAKVFMGALVEFFYQNGGKNFVTLSIRMQDPWWYLKGRNQRYFTVTVQAEDGESPAQQLTRLRNRVTELEAQLASKEN